MKIHTLRTLCMAVLMISLTALHSCKKDGNTAGSSSSTATLTGSLWTFQKLEYQKPDGTWIPDPQAQNADKITVLFNTNGTFQESHQSTGYNVTGNWTLTSNFSVLTATGGIIIYGAFTVSQLTSSTLVITMLNYPANVAYSNERLTFTH